LSKTGSSTPATADAMFEGLDFLAQLTELVPSILYVFDLEENRNVWGNRDLFVTLGYQREQVAAMGDRLLETILHPDDWPAYERHRERLLQLRDGELAELEYRVSRADGTWCWLYSREMVFRRSTGGGVRQIVGVAHDITRRRETEQALLESESRYRTLFESNPHPMFVTDLDSLRYLAVNDAAVAKYGYSRDEFLSMTIADVRPREDVPRLLEAAEERARKPGFDAHGLWRHRLKNGDVIDVEITSHALEFDGHNAALVLAHDVTERRRAERELRESENRFRIALAASPVVVFEQDRDLRYTWIHNPAPDFVPDSVLGRTDEELLGKGGAELSELKRHVLETGSGVRREVVLPLPSGRRDYDL
jgi:PAS domain S-box-containing protein